MKFYGVIFVSGLLAIVGNHSASAQDAKYRMKGDHLDVPVRAGYRIAGNDDDGFLEDGIIVAQKGTGYIDKKYRHRYEQTFDYKPMGSVYEVPVPRQSQQNYQRHPQQYQASPSASPLYDSYYYPKALASNVVYSRYAVPEIIYGRREW